MQTSANIATKNYNKANVFYKIIQGELDAKIIYEDNNLLCFYDAYPKCKTHALLIPKALVVDFDDFVAACQNSPLQIADFFAKAKHIAANVLGLKNYQLHTNNGAGAGQVVFHFHLHIMSNE